MSKIETQRPHVWTTFNETKTIVSCIDHQHLSNIYWYHLIFFDTKLVWAIEEISERFNGQLLPYRPHVKFTDEITELEKKGMLKWEIDLPFEIQKIGTIKYKNEIIGEIKIAKI